MDWRNNYSEVFYSLFLINWKIMLHNAVVNVIELIKELIQNKNMAKKYKMYFVAKII